MWYGSSLLWYSEAYAMFFTNPFPSTQCAAVTIMSPTGESTTLAEQKCALLPVVENSAPTVGTPAKCTDLGIFFAILPFCAVATCGTAVACAAAIRAGVQ